jgi:hypothetical protein
VRPSAIDWRWYREAAAFHGAGEPLQERLIVLDDQQRAVARHRRRDGSAIAIYASTTWPDAASRCAGPTDLAAAKRAHKFHYIVETAPTNLK